MTIEKGIELLQPFMDECEKTKDPYFAAHFSREEDRYNGFHSELDKFDAAILVRQLIKDFKIDGLLLNSLLNDL